LYNNVILPAIFGILILGVLASSQIAAAQDLDTSYSATKESQKMDSSLAELYDLHSQGQSIPASFQISPDGEKVKVVIELNNVEVGIPQNLGIEVETSYENMFQALVPIQNLESIASDENVKFIRMPIEMTLTAPQTGSEIVSPIQPSESETISPIQPSENENASDNFNFIYLVIIPVIVLPIIFYKIKKRN